MFFFEGGGTSGIEKAVWPGPLSPLVLRFEVFKSLPLISVIDFTFNWDLNQKTRTVLEAYTEISK